MRPVNDDGIVMMMVVRSRDGDGGLHSGDLGLRGWWRRIDAQTTITVDHEWVRSLHVVMMLIIIMRVVMMMFTTTIMMIMIISL